MKTSPSPLQIGNYFFTEIKLEANPVAKEMDLDRVSVDVDVETFLRNKDNPREWCVIVRVKIVPLEGASAPYSGEVEVFGTFSVAHSWPEAQVEQLVYINGSGILFGAAREMVCLITGRGFWKMLTLPCLSFNEMWKAKEAERTAEAKKRMEALTPAPALAASSAPAQPPHQPA